MSEKLTITRKTMMFGSTMLNWKNPLVTRLEYGKYMNERLLKFRLQKKRDIGDVISTYGSTMRYTKN